MPDDSALVESQEILEAFGEKTRQAYESLEPRQQKFILKYLDCLNGSEAYRHAYNKNANTRVAQASASRLLSNVIMKSIVSSFSDTREEDFITVRRVFLEAAEEAVKPIYGKDADGQPEKIEDLPDHDVRIKAAQALAKLQGLNAPDKVEARVAAVHLHFDAMDEAL